MGSGWVGLLELTIAAIVSCDTLYQCYLVYIINLVPRLIREISSMSAGVSVSVKSPSTLSEHILIQTSKPEYLVSEFSQSLSQNLFVYSMSIYISVQTHFESKDSFLNFTYKKY